MTFRLPNKGYNLNYLVREMGYRPIGFSERGEMNCVRPLGADYPRFHLYLKEEPETLTFNLHLDQKKPSYGGGAHAHSGDYDSEIVREEAERIREIVARA